MSASVFRQATKGMHKPTKEQMMSLLRPTIAKMTEIKPQPKSWQADWAWPEQDIHTCEHMYGSTYLMTPHAIAAIWRIIHCRRCNFAYHPRLAANPNTAELYVRFGGNLKLVHSTRPKTLIRDLPTIKAVTAKGVKSDPRLRYAQSKEDNDYLITHMGDAAIIAGLINPNFVTPDLESPLVQNLIKYCCASSIPLTEEIMNHVKGVWFIECIQKCNARQLQADSPIDDEKTQIFIAQMTVMRYSKYAYYLFIKDGSDPVDVDEVVAFHKEESYVKLVSERLQKCIAEYKEKNPDRTLVDDLGDVYLASDVGAVQEKDSDKNTFYIKPHNRCQTWQTAKFAEKARNDRQKLFGDMGKVMPAAQVRRTLMEMTLRRYFEIKKYHEDTFSANCDFERSQPYHLTMEELKGN
jgi:hypothetical protein